MTNTRTALIGHTGFVGETLKRHTHFDALFHSTDIQKIEGGSFDLVVCAGAPAAKWKANQDPPGDRLNIEKLMRHLSTVSAHQFVLISTVDVFDEPLGVDEDSTPTPGPSNAYGSNRLLLESYLRDKFRATVVRLPGLFGTGLRKNAIYDLLHQHNVDLLQPMSTFQFYDMSGLWSDLLRILAARVPVAHVCPEPVRLLDVARSVFQCDMGPRPSIPVVHYDLRTRFGSLWGRTDGHTHGRDEVIAGLQAFVASEKGGAGA